jgi:hypothetical protein
MMGTEAVTEIPLRLDSCHRRLCAVRCALCAVQRQGSAAVRHRPVVADGDRGRVEEQLLGALPPLLSRLLSQRAVRY